MPTFPRLHLPNRNPLPAASPVSLRRAQPADAALVVGWRSEASARRYQPLRPSSIDDVRSLFAAQANRTVGPRLAGDIYWIVEAGDTAVGRVSLYGINREHGRGEVSCLIGERYQGRGYGTAALRALAGCALTSDGADLWRIEAAVAVEHVASRRMVERVGFQCEGIARSYWMIDDEWLDVARYALLRPEWQAIGSIASNHG